ncbi:MAG: 2-dehydropantoate 2-reductase [Clostridiales bacterium]|nr:2-dehydropantoate 2-reductase [Clostridiales bacterium]
MNKDIKITIAGVGGVGGYLAGMLAKTYPHVTLIARGERKRSLEEKGIRLHSEFSGEITARPERIVEKGTEITAVQDVILICVKTYSLEEICEDLLGCVDEHTMILPVMNGADTGERTRAFLTKGIVVDAVIFITSFFLEDYSIRQIGSYAKINIGIPHPDAREKAAVQKAWEMMQEAGIDCRRVEDIEAAVWEKYIFNCGYNVLTSYYMEMVEDLQASGEKCREYITLTKETLAVAHAKNIHVREGYVESEYQRFMSLDAGSTSSMKRDLEAGRKSELETFSGYLVAQAHRLGVPVPLSERMYRELSARITKNVQAETEN